MDSVLKTFVGFSLKIISAKFVEGWTKIVGCKKKLAVIKCFQKTENGRKSHMAETGSCMSQGLMITGNMEKDFFRQSISFLFHTKQQCSSNFGAWP